VDVVGVNNRNLKNFDVSLEVSLQLAEHIPASILKISESGISQPANLLPLWQAGYRGFLVGENFMKTEDPGQACAAFVEAAQSQLGIAARV
jgi:indole-3-glycerol phosphate synthase